MKAFSPSEVRKHKGNVIPAEILDATNDLLAARYTPGRTISIKLKDIVELAKEKMTATGNPQASENFYSKNWMDIESLYEDAGWRVSFDKPGYNESYDAFFNFTEKRGRPSDAN